MANYLVFILVIGVMVTIYGCINYLVFVILVGAEQIMDQRILEDSIVHSVNLYALPFISFNKDVYANVVINFLVVPLGNFII